MGRGDPFSLIPTPSGWKGGREVTSCKDTGEQEGEYTRMEVLPNGSIVKVKEESGIPVILENVGSIADWFRRAMEWASILTVEEGMMVDVSKRTHIEVAMLRLAQSGSEGNISAIREMLDRIMGKPKQYIESSNLNVTLDELLRDINVGDTGSTASEYMGEM